MQPQVSTWIEEAAQPPKLLCIHCLASQYILAESFGELLLVEFFALGSLIGSKDEQQVSEDELALFPPILMSERVHLPVLLWAQ